MAIHDKNGLLNRMLQLIRSAGINGKTTAQNVRDFITDLIDTMFSLAGSGSASGSTDFEWDPEEEYNTTDNKFAISRLRIFKSKVDNNIGNEPPYITDEFGNYEDDFWVEVSAAPKSGIIPYAPGTFLDNDELVIVYHNFSLLLLTATRPFESTDVAAELAAGQWFDLGDTINQSFTEITASAITINPIRKIGNNYLFSVDGNRTFTIDFTDVPEGASGIIEIKKDNTATPRYIAVPADSFVHENDYTEENDVNESPVNITNAADNGSGLIRITAVAHGFTTGDRVNIQNVEGTIEANGKWTVTVIDVDTFDLENSTFANSYTSGGTAAKLANYLNIEQVANAVTIISFYCRNSKFYMNLRKGYLGF